MLLGCSHEVHVTVWSGSVQLRAWLGLELLGSLLGDLVPGGLERYVGRVCSDCDLGVCRLVFYLPLTGFIFQGTYGTSLTMLASRKPSIRSGSPTFT